MREIKFRAWDTRENCWFSGFSLHCNGHYTDKTVNEFIKDPQNFWGDTPENIKIMQYIGLHDKNGKPIYEGDIVKVSYDRDNGYKDTHRDSLEVVDFENCAFVLREVEDWKDKIVVPSTFFERIYCDSKSEYIFEVIGNVWENPNLIK